MSHHRPSPRREAEPSAEPPWHRLPIAEVARQLASDPETGLRSAEARQRLHRCGRNALTSTPRHSALSIIVAQFRSLIVVLLVAAAAIALLLEERVEAVAILVVIGLNAAIGFLTELRAEQAITALQQQTVPTAHAVRDGAARAIPAADLVPGDVVILTAGERVPADGRVLESVRLQVQEAALTGESLSVGKTAEALGTADGELPLGDRANMAYLGTVVTDGRGLMMVTATGMRTEVGKIGRLIDEAVRRETPLERRLEQLGRRVFEGRMKSHCVWKISKAIGARAGVPELHPHAFRHSCGVELLRCSGENLRAVQEHLRRADIQTTTVYTRLTQSDLQKVISEFDKNSGEGNRD